MKTKLNRDYDLLPPQGQADVRRWRDEHPSVPEARLVAMWEAVQPWSVDTSVNAKEALQELSHAIGFNQVQLGYSPMRRPNDALRSLGQQLGVDVKKWMEAGYADGLASGSLAQNPGRKQMPRKKKTSRKRNARRPTLTDLRKKLPKEVKIKYDSDIGEYTVIYDGAEYFTDDWEDAVATGIDMWRRDTANNPSEKRKRNPMTKREFEKFFRHEVLPEIAKVYEQDGVPDRPARREAWNDMVDAWVQDGELPEAAIDWAIPDRLETVKVKLDDLPYAADTWEMANNPSDNLRWTVAPVDQGQMVEVAYASDPERGVYYKRKTDRSTGEVTHHFVRMADHPRVSWEPWNEPPRIRGWKKVPAAQSNPSYPRRKNPPKGTIKIEREGYCVKPTTYKRDGKTIRRDAYCVPPSTFYIKDRGKPGRGPDIVPELKQGALQGWHADESKTERHKALDKCVKKASYRTCLGRLQWLKTLGKRTMSPDVLAVIEEDRQWLVDKYGGPGSFKRSERRERARESRAAANPDIQALKRKLMR